MSESTIDVPAGLRERHALNFGGTTAAWLDALPGLIAALLERWDLTPDGTASHGNVAMVLPVRRPDGGPAVLKLQPVDEETVGEPVALRAWYGYGAVTLLNHDPVTGSMLLERLDAARSLAAVPDVTTALRTLSGVLARLHEVPAPDGVRRLAEMTPRLLDRVPRGLTLLTGPGDRDVVRDCAAALREVLPEPGDRLLHWDLHYENVLASVAGEGWLAIDPKPLAGDPGFDLLPALHNRWEAAGGVPGVLRRFDLMTEVLGLDRPRAARWTLVRVLQNVLWAAEAGAGSWSAGPDRLIAETLRDRRC
ncbi:aminoglycoside phosphotransferase family protein [Actinoplanes sp. NPDC051851]|uniref:aminoglycoside phosphotransferase family protein n=1 Tax=Actinoplanes sp. NPDC051851 TaxID=3154753 RepID=UPI00343F580E